LHILSKISFTPVINKHLKHSEDQITASQDKCNQLNKMNRVKITLNHPYIQFLVNIYSHYSQTNNLNEFAEYIG
ncbi:hypothetical protein V6O07_23180, partial [Arthrospira platensis SPKY2]